MRLETASSSAIMTLRPISSGARPPAPGVLWRTCTPTVVSAPLLRQTDPDNLPLPVFRRSRPRGERPGCCCFLLSCERRVLAAPTRLSLRPYQLPESAEGHPGDRDRSAQ